MSQRKWTPFLIILLLLASLITPIILAGYSSLNKAENAKANGEKKDAYLEYAQAAKILFWRDDLWEKAGIFAFQAGEFSTAITYLEIPAELTEEGWVSLGGSYYQNGDLASVISTCTHALQTYDSSALYQLLAFSYHDQKEWQAELSALKEQTRLDPNDAYAHYRLGLLLTLYSPDQALPSLTRASALNPELDSAIQTLRAALAVSSVQTDESEKMLIIGRAFGLLQDWELAMAAFEKAVQIDDENAEAWAWLGEAKQQLGQDGSVELDRALMLDHTSANVRALRGLYWSRQEKYQQMLSEYLLAAEFEPENPRWQVSMGEAYSKLGELVLALEAYHRAADLAPDEPDYWRLLAIFCVENSVQVEDIGLPAAQKALSLAPDNPFVLDTLGFAYLSSGRFTNAEQTLKQAIELMPDNYSAHIHLAMTYLALGDQTAAYNSLTYVRDADTSRVYADLAIQLLQRYFP
ncbi:MAG TPA: tetratricopeptide repeat protein [Anaerolineales bacterium]|nr:tetratricopeptide repeat protein [Anaerolineales bacterium]